MIKITKEQYNAYQLDQCQNSKQSWLIINKLLGRSSPKANITMTENGIELDNLTMANKFNAHFNEVGEKFGSKPIKEYGYRKYMDKKI